MIVNFSIQNFGSIKEKQTLSFEADASKHLEDTYVVHTAGKRLLKLALIYGANASGKTTVLKALDSLRDLVVNPKEKKTDILYFDPFLFDAQTPQQPTKLSIEFVHKEVYYQYEVAFTRQAVIWEALFNTSKKILVYKRTTDIKEQLTKISFGDNITIDKNAKQVLELNTLWNNTVLGGFLKFRRVADWFANYLKPIIAPQTQLGHYITEKIDERELAKEEVLEILNKADFNISDIIIQENKKQNNLFLEHTIDNISYNLPLNIESEGPQTLLWLCRTLSSSYQNTYYFPYLCVRKLLTPRPLHSFLAFLPAERSAVATYRYYS